MIIPCNDLSADIAGECLAVRTTHFIALDGRVWKPEIESSAIVGRTPASLMNAEGVVRAIPLEIACNSPFLHLGQLRISAEAV